MQRVRRMNPFREEYIMLVQYRAPVLQIYCVAKEQDPECICWSLQNGGGPSPNANAANNNVAAQNQRATPSNPPPANPTPANPPPSSSSAGGGSSGGSAASSGGAAGGGANLRDCHLEFSVVFLHWL